MSVSYRLMMRLDWFNSLKLNAKETKIAEHDSQRNWRPSAVLARCRAELSELAAQRNDTESVVKPSVFVWRPKLVLV